MKRICERSNATGETEEQAMANYADAINTTVLTGSHHGATTEGSNGRHQDNADWSDVTDPEILIYQSGIGFGHPRCDVTDSYDGETVTTREHSFHCGLSNGNIFSVRRDEPTREAKYATERNGTIVLSTDGETSVCIECSLTPECEDTLPL